MVNTAATNASRNTDYTADGATLTFPSGDTIRSQSLLSRLYDDSSVVEEATPPMSQSAAALNVPRK